MKEKYVLCLTTLTSQHCQDNINCLIQKFISKHSDKSKVNTNTHNTSHTHRMTPKSTQLHQHVRHQRHETAETTHSQLSTECFQAALDRPDFQPPAHQRLWRSQIEVLSHITSLHLYIGGRDETQNVLRTACE
jgi:hypothetical protein